MKEKIKRSIFFIKYKKIKLYFELKKEFKKEYLFYKNNFIDNSTEKIDLSTNQIKFYILYLVHSLEKGMCSLNLRPFGEKKIKLLIDLLNGINEKDCFEYNLGCSCLLSYINLYIDNSWDDRKEFVIANDFIKGKKFDNLKVGKQIITKEELLTNFNYADFVESRHSVRQYENKEISLDDLKKAIEITKFTPSACNRQMCKLYYIKDKDKREKVFKFGHGFGGFDFNSTNIFLITFDANSSISTGEINQGYFNSGLFGMNFVNSLHSLGIGSCFIQVGNTYYEEEKLKKELNISASERIAVIVAAGYYTNSECVPYSTRKNNESIYTILD